VQEAADDDANIIFGAVVDPALKGKVKITVIATGFDPHLNARTSSGARTPVDMSPYGDASRMRADIGVSNSGPGLTLRRQVSVTRRPIVEMPPSGGSTPINGVPLLLNGEAQLEPPDRSEAPSTLDVPAFLRRQEG